MARECLTPPLVGTVISDWSTAQLPERVRHGSCAIYLRALGEQLA